MFTNFFPASEASGALDLNTLARESGYYFQELSEVEEILKLRHSRPPTAAEILAEMQARQAPKMRTTQRYDYDEAGL
jgi:hypothetical protein